MFHEDMAADEPEEEAMGDEEGRSDGLREERQDEGEGEDGADRGPEVDGEGIESDAADISDGMHDLDAS